MCLCIHLCGLGGQKKNSGTGGIAVGMSVWACVSVGGGLVLKLADGGLR